MVFNSIALTSKYFQVTSVAIEFSFGGLQFIESYFNANVQHLGNNKKH